MDASIHEKIAKMEDRHWWYVGRRKIIKDAITRLGLKAGARILEVGCGSGGNLPVLAKFGDVHAIEMDDPSRVIAQERYGRIARIQSGRCPDDMHEDDGPFDLICMFDVLEHVQDDATTLDRLRLMLNNGGWLLITVPAYMWLWSANDVENHHFRRYTRTMLRNDLKRAGFDEMAGTYFNSFMLPAIAGVRVISTIAGSRTNYGVSVPPGPINALLISLLSVEAAIIPVIGLPAGVSVMGAYQKAR